MQEETKMKRARRTRGRNFKIEERKIIYQMVVNGASLVDINLALDQYQKANLLSYREIPESSYKMMQNTYLPYITNAITMNDFARKPPPMGMLNRS